MKYFNVFIVCFIAMLFISGTVVNAQQEEIHCAGDPTCPWSSEKTITFVCGPCQYTAYYKTRVCPAPPYNGIPQFKIDRVFKADTSCTGCDDDVLMDMISELIIEEELWVPDGANNCILNISGYRAACWIWGGTSPGGGVWLEPCGPYFESGCCRSIWFICNDGDGNPIYPAVKQGTLNIEPCDPMRPPSCFTLCPD